MFDLIKLQLNEKINYFKTIGLGFNGIDLTSVEVFNDFGILSD